MRTMLIAIKLAHTVVWALLAGCILALPLTAWKRRFDLAVVLTIIVLMECGVLALNGGRCPMTNLAARYTDQRADNFDIYLPLVLARYNKQIFGTLFLVNEAVVLGHWKLNAKRVRRGAPDSPPLFRR